MNEPVMHTLRPLEENDKEEEEDEDDNSSEDESKVSSGKQSKFRLNTNNFIIYDAFKFQELYHD